MVWDFTLSEINTVAAALWQKASGCKVWALYAPMGSGKTTFVHALCKEVLQVSDAVSSPTFAIINEYQSAVAGIIYHIDLYRLKNAEEAMQAGVEDCLLSGNLCLVEWPELAPEILPENALRIYIETINETTRRIRTDNLPD